jgi:hypothetical protein
MAFALREAWRRIESAGEVAIIRLCGDAFSF